MSFGVYGYALIFYYCHKKQKNSTTILIHRLSKKSLIPKGMRLCEKKIITDLFLNNNLLGCIAFAKCRDTNEVLPRRKIAHIQLMYSI